MPTDPMWCFENYGEAAEYIDQLEKQRDRMAAELESLRWQKPVAYVKYKATGGNVGLAWMAIPTGEFYPREGEKLYTAPVPAPAVPSGWNIRRDGDVLIVQHPDIGGCSVQKEPDWERMIPEAILYSLADALLQSAEVTDNAAADRLLEGVK